MLWIHHVILCLTHWILWRHMSTGSSWCFPTISPNPSRNWGWPSQERSTIPMDWGHRNGPFSKTPGLPIFLWMGWLVHDQRLDCLLIGHQSALSLTCGMPFANGWEMSPDYIFSVKLEQFIFNVTAVDKGELLPFLVITIVCCKMHDVLTG